VNWRTLLYLCLLAFVVTLATIIGWRLSDQAMAVIVGVVAGVAASIPTSLVVAWIALYGRPAFGPLEASPAAAAPAQPQVIYVQATPAAPSAAPASLTPQSQRSLTVLPVYAAPESTALNGLPLGPRQFTIIGENSA
jgi:hypothetical protein